MEVCSSGHLCSLADGAARSHHIINNEDSFPFSVPFVDLNNSLGTSTPDLAADDLGKSGEEVAEPLHRPFIREGDRVDGALWISDCICFRRR
jgi:hypothetical protein